MTPDAKSETTVTGDSICWRYLQGATVKEMIAESGLPVEEVLDVLRESMQRMVNEWLQLKASWHQQTHARVVLLERELWAALKRSREQQNRVTHKEVRDGKGERTEVTTVTTQASGDPRYLSLLLKCVDFRGTLEPGTTGKEYWERGSEQDAPTALREIIREARERMARTEARKLQADEIERTIARK